MMNERLKEITSKRKKFRINKKSQAEVITTVLIILLILVAVAIVSVFVMKFVRENSSFDDSNLDLFINNDKTFYYAGVPGTVYVAVQRGSGQLTATNLSSIKIKVVSNGVARICVRKNVPDVLETRVYRVNGFATQPDTVEVIPFLSNGVREKAVNSLGIINLISKSSPLDILDDEFGGSCGDEDVFPPEAPLPPFTNDSN